MFMEHPYVAGTPHIDFPNPLNNPLREVLV